MTSSIAFGRFQPRFVVCLSQKISLRMNSNNCSTPLNQIAWHGKIIGHIQLGHADFCFDVKQSTVYNYVKRVKTVKSKNMKDSHFVFCEINSTYNLEVTSNNSCNSLIDTYNLRCGSDYNVYSHCGRNCTFQTK